MMEDLTLADVILKEREQLRLRRQKLGLPEGAPLFGIAMSGGGIRSATINLGFLKTLNRYGILQQADYLSTVSGGGYTHSYLQGTLKQNPDYQQLFTQEQIELMRKHGEYMTPGQGIWKSGNLFLLIIGFLVSWAMSLMGLVIVGGIFYFLYLSAIGAGLANPLNNDNNDLINSILSNGGWVFLSLLCTHFLANIAQNFSLGISKLFNYIEAAIALLAAGVYARILLGSIQLGNSGISTDGSNALEHDVPMDAVPRYLLIALALFIAGFFTNPNALSFHRYYRKQLADLFLRFSGSYANIKLKDVFNAESDNKRDYIAPYPLINTCLNLQAPSGDAKFKGSKASDYFLLSPLYCGSKLTAYVPTGNYWDYRYMTLPAAVTISAAAVNPGLGMYSSPLLSALMTIFNARLGFWISNPMVLKKSYAIVWWPVYFFKELLGRIGTDNKMVNISDGGHIENLGVYELLRRECRLIIAFDAGEDKTYAFFDINNLLIRARNELGYEIRFRADQQPEELIRPRPSQVYSKQRFAIADIYQHWVDHKTINDKGEEESNIENFDTPKKVGTFVYVKSSVTAPVGKPDLPKDDYLRYGTYKYKIYHPDFPHEPTSDQFFDEIQWEAYYQLGQFIGADVLGFNTPNQHTGVLSTEELLRHFDLNTPLFAAGPADTSAMPPTMGEDVFESTKPAAAVLPQEGPVKITPLPTMDEDVFESTKPDNAPPQEPRAVAEPPKAEYRM